MEDNLSEYVKTVCKIGHGKECCRYLLTTGPTFFSCVKRLTNLKAIQDRLVLNGSKIEQGDNCEGKNPIP